MSETRIGPDQSTTLRERRSAAGLSIRELEQATGINRGRLSILERGVQPRPAEAEAIDRAIAAARAAQP